MTEKQIAFWIDCMDKTENDFINEKIFLEKKFKGEPNANDVIWAMLNNKIREVAPNDANRYSKLFVIYDLMSTFLYKIEDKDPFSILKEVRKYELLRIKDAGIYPKVSIFTLDEGVCSTAKKIKNKVYTLEDALKLEPLPDPKCKCKIRHDKIPICCCSYRAEIE